MVIAAWPARPLVNPSGPSAPSPPRGHGLVGHSRSLDVNAGLAHLSFVTLGMWRRRGLSPPPFVLHGCFSLTYAHFSHLFEKRRPRDSGVSAWTLELVEAGVEARNRTCVFRRCRLSLQDVADSDGTPPPHFALHLAQQMVNMQSGFGAELLSEASRVSRADGAAPSPAVLTCAGGSDLRPPAVPPNADSLSGGEGERRATPPEPPEPPNLSSSSASCCLDSILGLSAAGMTQHAGRMNESHGETSGSERCRCLPSARTETTQAGHGDFSFFNHREVYKASKNFVYKY